MSRRIIQAKGVSLVLLFAALAFDCTNARTEQSDPTGGETHFLTRCDASSNPCGGDLSCVCGVCTRSCDSRKACDGLPEAVCVAPGDAEACVETAPRCDVPCVADQDCTTLSPRHRCELGACRADSGAGGGPTSPGADDAGACAYREASANQVLVLGDSFFALRHEITAYLEGLARARGIIGAGERYRDGSNLLDNGLAIDGNGVTRQYDAAADEAGVEVVIMNGGGADVLAATCDTSDCPPLTAAADGARELLARMSEDGVREVVYAFYPDPVEPSVRAKVDILRPLIETVCRESPVPCRWLDLRATFDGRADELIEADGLNPTSEGARAAAQAIWSTLEAACGKQP